MDAEGYLKSHGWRGLGYSLDQKDRGLKKPLLVSQKIDVLGVGKQKHQAQADQWWMRAFDESLKQIGTGQKTTLDSVRKNGINKGGLYGFFVQGEALHGTINDPINPDMSNSGPLEVRQPEERNNKKRKRDESAAGKVEKRSEKVKRNKDRIAPEQQMASALAVSQVADGKDEDCRGEPAFSAKGDYMQQHRGTEAGLGSDSVLISESTAKHLPNGTNGDIMGSGSLAPGTDEIGIMGDVTTKPGVQSTREHSTSAEAVDSSFDFNADVISLGLPKKRRTKKIPGVGAVERYPSKAEKRQKKLDSQASAAGLTLEQYKKKLYDEKAEKEAPERQRIAEVQATRGGLNAKDYHKQTAQKRDAAANAIYMATGKYPLPGTYDPVEVLRSSDHKQRLSQDAETNLMAVDTAAPSVTSTPTVRVEAEKQPEWHELTAKRRAQYAERAAEKGQSPEDYYARRVAKKAKIAATATSTAAKADTGAASAIEPAAGARPIIHSAQLVTGDPTLSFVIDTVGDQNLSKAKSSKPPPLRWHPDMLGDRKVKELSKAERKARQEWMRARREARHAAVGRNTATKKEKEKKRMTRKQHKQNSLVSEILKDAGTKKNEAVGKQQLREARRKARRQMRELKKQKRNKVIHRK